MRTLCLIIAFVGLNLFLKAQHPPMLSQYMFNGLVINPAYTGSRDVLSLTGVYRHQWSGLEGAPRTQSIFLHSPLKNPKNNVGFMVVGDRIGVSNHTTIQCTYAYRIAGDGGGRLSFGMQGGVSLLRDNWSSIVTDEPDDNVFLADSPTFLVPRVGAGAYYDRPRWYIGISSPFLLDYKNSDYKLYVAKSINHRPALLTGGFLIRLNPDLLMKPSFLVKYIKGSPVETDINVNLIVKDVFWVGASYRTGDAIIAMLEYQISPQFRIGYAYDYSITPLQRFNGGSHEFMLRYEFGYKLKAMSPRYF